MQQQQAHAMQQAHPASAAAAARRRTCLPSPCWANQRVEMGVAGPRARRVGAGQPLSTEIRHRWRKPTAVSSGRRERELYLITEATDTANQGRGCGVRSSSKSGCWIAPCRSPGVVSVGTWRRRRFSRLGVPSVFFPPPAPLVMGNKRAFPVAFTLTAISRAPSAPRTAQPGRSVSISDNGGCRRRRSAPRHVTGLSHRSRGIQSAIYPRYLGEQQAGAGKCHRRGCAEGRRGVVCPRA